MGDAWPRRQIIISDEATQEPELGRFRTWRKLITVLGQNPHVEETEEEEGETNFKKDKSKTKKTQSRPKFSQNWNSAK
jgi:hypothetical protein